MVRVLPAAVTTAINNQEIWTTQLIDMTVGNTTYRISDHYRQIEVGGNLYIPNGDLLRVDNITDKAQADNDSIEIGLSAIDPSFRADIIAADAAGGRVDVYRGFINSNTGDLLADPILLWEGVIFSISLSQDYSINIGADVLSQSRFTAVADVRALTFRLDEQPGRFTNAQSFRDIDPLDEAADFVAGLDGRNVRFGGDG